jgi:hypothetical protein
MAKITLDLPDDLVTQLATAGESLPELLRMSLQQSPVPNKTYRYILNFLTSNPTTSEIATFRPTAEIVERLQILVSKEHSGNITSIERSELDEYERMEHLIIMLKKGNLQYLNSTHE